MRKNLLLISFLTLLLTSCGNSGQPQDSTDAPCDSIMSTDLAFYRLHGRVKTVFYTDTGLQIQFDAQGNLISFDGKDPYVETAKIEKDSLGNEVEYSAFKKNKQGQIVQILGVGSVNTYTWENGQVVGDTGSGQGMTWNCTYENDAQGNAIFDHAQYNDVFNNVKSSGTTTYTILARDSHGNWLERSAKYVPDTPSDEDKESSPYKQTRTITYYE